MTQKYFQAPAVSYCLLDNVCIFLDRQGDKYHYLDRKKTGLLESLRNGLGPEDALPKNETSSAFHIVQELVSKNLLTENGTGKALEPVAHQIPSASVYDSYWKRRLHPTTIAYLASKHHKLQQRLKQESLYDTTQKAEKLKDKAGKHNSNLDSEKILDKARRIIDSRYFVYTYKDKCLFDSCLFFEHFTKQGIPVDWVFGVNLYPFSAHAWVEYEGLVLNDELERIAAFTPIYVI